MKRFHLYHPGDLLAAVVPCMGPRASPVVSVSEYGAAPPPSAKRN